MEHPSKHLYDVIIVGAGPAGATLGYELTREGLDVLILEKDRLPRYKTCAGGITVKAAELLDLDISPVVQHTVYGFRVKYKNKKEFTRWYDQPLIYMVMRDEFDHFLVQRAQATGAVVADDQRVSRLQVTFEGVEVLTDQDVFTTRILVGADGARSIVAENLGLMTGTRFGVGMEAEIAVSKEKLAEWDSLAGLSIGHIRGGFGWVFPKKDHLSVGIGGSLRQAKRLKSRYREVLASHDLGSHEIIKLRSHYLPVRRNGAAIQCERSLLIGDAAGLVDPFTGEGIYNAVKSACIAAPIIIQSLQTDNVDLTGYQEAVDRELMPELKASRAFSKIYTWFPGLYFDAVKGSDRLWRAHCRVLRGERSYVSIKKKLGVFQFLVDLFSR